MKLSHLILAGLSRCFIAGAALCTLAARLAARGPAMADLAAIKRKIDAR